MGWNWCTVSGQLGPWHLSLHLWLYWVQLAPPAHQVWHLLGGVLGWFGRLGLLLVGGVGLLLALGRVQLVSGQLLDGHLLGSGLGG